MKPPYIIIRYFNIDDGYFIFLEEIYNARK